MRQRIVIAVVFVAAVTAGTLSAALPAPGGNAPLPDPTRDIGTGERVLLVVGGRFDSRSDAEQAGARLSFGALQGFFVVPSAAFDGIEPGRWLLASAFRTAEGARQFEALATAAGATPLSRLTAVYRGRAWIGLGLEPHPDGSGPLSGPLPPGHPSRI